MTPLPRAPCPVCRGEVALRTNGVTREHADRRHAMYGVPGAVRDGKAPKCAGSNRLPDILDLQESLPVDGRRGAAA